MAFKLPTRSFYVDSSGLNPLILKFSIFPINNILLLQYDLYQLMNESKEYFAQIEKEFFDDPESTVVDKLNKRLLNSNKISINEIYQFSLYLQGKLQTVTRQDIGMPINLIFDGKMINISLMPYQVASLHAFVFGFGSNYEMYKIKVYEILKQEQAEQATVNIITTERRTEDSSVEVCNDVMKLICSNLTVYYLTSVLRNVNANVNVELKDKVYIISMQPLYSLCLTKQNELMIRNQILDIKLSNEELSSLTKQLFKILNQIIIGNNLKSNIPNIYIICYLLFLYSLKVNYEVTALSMNYNIKGGFELIVNKILASLAPIYKLDYVIQINLDHKYSPGYKLDEQDFELIIKKYAYLADMDKHAFISSVINDLISITKEGETTQEKIEIDLPATFLTKGNLLKVDEVLANNSKNPPPAESLLNYKLITSNDNKFITKNYFDLYKLISTGLPPVDKSLHKVIKLYYDPIIKILNDLDDSKMLSLDNISVLFLVDNFIKPRVPYKADNLFDILFILYQVIIPHLYNKRSMNNFIDYFH
jgi:hypothetical protein